MTQVRIPRKDMALTLEVKAAAAALATIVLFWIKKRRDSRQLPLPPGPSRLPVLGNVHQLPKSEEWIKYHEWCRQYDTDIIYLNFMGMAVVVLDTPEAASELLDRKSYTLSSRPNMTMISDLMGWDGHLGIMPYGERWRKHRRAMYQYFNATTVLKFCPAELKATHGFLRRLLAYKSVSVCDGVIPELRQMAGETIVRVTYGLPVLEKNDPFIEAIERGSRPFNEGLQVSKFMVDLLPVLKHLPDWMPGAAFKRKAMEWRKTTQEMINVPFNGTKEKLHTGEVTFSFASESLLEIDPADCDAEEKETVIKNTASAIFGAGSESALSAIGSCIIGFLERPDVLKKAQHAVDEVTRGERLPTYNDLEQLPYITAIVWETLRWQNVAPIAIPHYTDTEVEYKGYRIPAGTTVIPNIWAMLHNPEVYPDPFTFNPDRFFKDGQLDRSVKDPSHAVWGFGRRICPGRHMAFTAAWIAIASLVATFDIAKAKDSEGNIVEPGVEYDVAVLRIPKPFKCSIKPRSKEAEDLVLATSFDEA